MEGVLASYVTMAAKTNGTIEADLKEYWRYFATRKENDAPSYG